MSDEEKKQKLVDAKAYLRNCLVLNSPDDLSVATMAKILPWAEYWKLHDYVEWVKGDWWNKLRKSYLEVSADK